MNAIPIDLNPCPECKEPDYHLPSCSMFESKRRSALLIEQLNTLKTAMSAAVSMSWAGSEDGKDQSIIAAKAIMDVRLAVYGLFGAKISVGDAKELLNQKDD